MSHEGILLKNNWKPIQQLNYLELFTGKFSDIELIWNHLSYALSCNKDKLVFTWKIIMHL